MCVCLGFCLGGFVFFFFGFGPAFALGVSGFIDDGFL